MATNLKIGDLIEIFRGIYKHWALYVGDGDVIHLTTVSGRANAGSCCVGSVGRDKATVKREKLEDVVRQNKYRINNLLDNQYKSRPIQDILKDAQSHLGEMIRYNPFTLNCEHFATLLRYGTPESRQAETAALGVIGALIGAVAVFGISVIRAILKI